MPLLFTACQKFHRDTSSGLERYPKAIKMLHDRRKLDLRGRAAWRKRRSDARPVRGCACTNGPIPAGTVIRAASTLELHSPLSTEDTLQQVSPPPTYCGEASSPNYLRASAATISS